MLYYRYSIHGAADGLIDGTDLTTIITNWGQTGLGRTGGDLNGNGTVDGNDYSEVLSYWSLGAPGPTVPEPATLALLLIGSLPMIRTGKRSLRQ